MTIVPHSHVTGDAPITRKMQLRPLDIEQSDGKLALVQSANSKLDESRLLQGKNCSRF